MPADMVTVRRSKQLGHMKRSVADYFWRASFDSEQLQILTDRPVTDLVH